MGKRKATHKLDDRERQYPFKDIAGHRVEDDGTISLLVVWAGRWEPTHEPESLIRLTADAAVNEYFIAVGTKGPFNLSKTLADIVKSEILQESKRSKERAQEKNVEMFSEQPVPSRTPSPVSSTSSDLNSNDLSTPTPMERKRVHA